MAFIKITRLDGESDEDWKRRYRREYMHAYYHAFQSRERKPRKSNPKPGRISKKYNIVRREGEDEREFQKRADRERKRINRAVARGADPGVSGETLEKRQKSNSPLTREEWVEMQRRPDETVEAWQLRVNRNRMARYEAQAPGKRAAQVKANRLDNADWERERAKEWRQHNPDKVKAHQKRYLDKHPERLQALLAWAIANPERTKKVRAEWALKNRHVFNQSSKEWREQVAIATPQWVKFDAVLAIYLERDRLNALGGIQYAVDHIVPLRKKGPNGVCGLHTHHNLRIIPVRENSRKYNKIDHALIQALVDAERHLYPFTDDQT